MHMEFPEAFFSSPSALLASVTGILHVSLGIFTLGAIFLAVFLYALFAEKKAMVATAFALIFSGFLFMMFPYWGLLDSQSDAFGGQKDIYLKAGVLAVIFLAVRFAIRHSVRGNYAYERSRKIADALGLSLVTSGLILIYGYRFTSLSEFYPLSPEITGFLVAPQAFFWWLVGVLVVVYFFSD